MIRPTSTSGQKETKERPLPASFVCSRLPLKSSLEAMGLLYYSGLLCFLAALIAWLNYDKLYAPLESGFDIKSENIYPHKVVIGVLSARGNFAHRSAVRDTWAGFIQSRPDFRNSVLVRFIIGSRRCHVLDEFREDPYSCSSLFLNTSIMNLRSEIVAFNVTPHVNIRRVNENKITGDAGVEYYGIDFKMNFDLVIKKLGIYDKVPLDHKPSVTLFDSGRQKPIVSVSFTEDDPGTLQDGYRFKNVELFLFPKEFEGTLVSGPANRSAALTPELELNPGQASSASNVHSTLLLRKILRKAKMAAFPNETVFLHSPVAIGNFIFEIHKPDKVERKMDISSSVHKTVQNMKEKIESEKLADEQQRNADLLFIDEIDVYRNIPKKMLHFFRWVANNTEVDFVIKTDDDCFLNIEVIMRILQDKRITAKSHSWWGSFRTNWPLDILGKWAEHEYPSPVYPAFACGSGNLLTRDLVSWIARNSKHFHTYQGEDVSMGIWLASILPTYIDDRRWQCDNKCHKDAFVLAEQSPEQLRLLWENWLKCQNPCNCS